MTPQDLALFALVCVGPAVCAVGLPLVAVAFARGLGL